MKLAFPVQRTLEVTLDAVLAFFCFRGSSFLSVPLLIQVGAFLMSICARMSLTHPYSCQTKTEYALYKEMITLGVALGSMWALMLTSGQAKCLLSSIMPSVLTFSMIRAALLTLIQVVSDLLTCLIIDHVVPYLYHHLGYPPASHSELNQLHNLYTKNLSACEDAEKKTEKKEKSYLLLLEKTVQLEDENNKLQEAIRAYLLSTSRRR